MYIDIKITFETDGDFHIDPTMFLKEDACTFLHKDYSEEYEITYRVYNKDLSVCAMFAADFLEQAFFSVRMCNHMFLWKYLYDMFESAIRRVRDLRSGTSCVLGNWTGTAIEVKVVGGDS